MSNVKNIFGLLLAVSLVVFSACNKDEDPKAVIPAAPVLNAAAEVTATGFKISWSAVQGADVYLLDVSKEADFDPTVTGYAKKEVTGTSQAVTGLTSATKYYFRVYSKKGSQVSAASAPKDATTLAAP